MNPNEKSINKKSTTKFDFLTHFKFFLDLIIIISLIVMGKNRLQSNPVAGSILISAAIICVFIWRIVNEIEQ